MVGFSLAFCELWLPGISKIADIKPHSLSTGSLTSHDMGLTVARWRLASVSRLTLRDGCSLVLGLFRRGRVTA